MKPATGLSHKEGQFHGCGGMGSCASSHNAVATVPGFGPGPEEVPHTTDKGGSSFGMVLWCSQLPSHIHTSCLLTLCKNQPQFIS